MKCKTFADAVELRMEDLKTELRRIIMKRNITRTLLVITCLATFTASMVSTTQAQCSNATALGAYGFTTTGSIILPSGPVPVVAVGRLTFTSAGTVFGSQTRSVGGSTAVERIAGTFSINPNCTGTIIAQVFVSGALVRTSTIATILVDSGRKSHAIFKEIVLPDGTILPSALTSEADRLF